MMPDIHISLPFDGCALCKYIDLETSKLYSEDIFGESKPVMVNHTCRHEEICRNAFKIWSWSETKN